MILESSAHEIVERNQYYFQIQKETFVEHTWAHFNLAIKKRILSSMPKPIQISWFQKKKPATKKIKAMMLTRHL